MDDILRDMLNALFTFDTSSLDNLSLNLADYNGTAYELVTNLHDTAVVPVSSVVISIVLVLELARNATHIEGDQQMGVKIIAATMFKSALLIVAAQNSTMFLDAINEIATSIIKGLSDAGDLSAGELPPGVTDGISSAGKIDKAGMLMLIIIPFLVALVAKIVIQVMVMMRFAELYMLSAFASLPIAMLGHPDTKSMGIGYLQRYAATGLQGVTLMMSVSIYSAISGVADIGGLESGQSLSSWIVKSYPQLLLAPVVLIFLVMASGRIAKALVGQ